MVAGRRRSSATSLAHSASTRTTSKSRRAYFPAARRYALRSFGFSSLLRIFFSSTSRRRTSTLTDGVFSKMRLRSTRERFSSSRTTSTSSVPSRLRSSRSPARAFASSPAATTTTARRRQLRGQGSGTRGQELGGPPPPRLRRKSRSQGAVLRRQASSQRRSSGSSARRSARRSRRN